VSAGLVKKLEEIVGREGVVSGETDLERYGWDATGLGARLPVALVRPRASDEVARVVALAWEEGLPVTARGGGTGLWAGAVPAGGGIVVSTERMTAEPEVHGEDLFVTAGPGVANRDLRKRVEAAGLFYPIDPGSEGRSTLGGNVAEGAVGMRGLKYGGQRNYVLGLELVTGEGKVLRVGAKTVKNVAGYDVTRLMVGSQGILGIVTSVTLKVVPLPQDRVVLAFAFEGGRQAAAAATGIAAGGVTPAAVEVMDRVTLAAVARLDTEKRKAAGAGGVAGDGDAGAGRRGERGLAGDWWAAARGLLLVELDGTRAACEAASARVREALARTGKPLAERQVRYPEAEGLWGVRRAALEALGATSPTVIIENLSVPPGRAADLVGRVEEVSQRHGVGIAAFGHAGEGVMHVAFLTDARDLGEAARADEARARLESACEPLGVRVSGRGGTGLAEMPPARTCLGGASLEIARRVKRAFDPDGILNPGKLTTGEPTTW
jgi:glycolate oxidase